MKHAPELASWSSACDEKAVFSNDNYKYEFELTEDRTQRELAMLQQIYSDLPYGGTLLDIGCGEGRIAYPLANSFRDASIIGIDRNARWNPTEAPDNTALVVADMRELPLADNSVDGSFMMFTTFGYFSDTDNITALREALRVTKPGGKVVIDCSNNDLILENFSPRQESRDRGDGVIVSYARELVILPTDIDAFKQPRYLVETRTADSGEELQSLYLRLYTQDDFSYLMKAANATSCSFFDEKLQPFRPDSSRRMTVILEK